MRISDWSSDVCSSDLAIILGSSAVPVTELQAGGVDQINLLVDRSLDIEVGRRERADCQPVVCQGSAIVDDAVDAGVESAAHRSPYVVGAADRQRAGDCSEHPHVGYGCVGMGRSRVLPCH